MNAAQRKITEADVLSDTDYTARRQTLRAASIEAKRNRRIEIGPFATLHFENYESMWLQVHEMLRIEKGGRAQIEASSRPTTPSSRRARS